MNHKSMTSHSPLDRCRCRRRGPIVERTIAARLAIVARIISRSQDRPPADADELCGRCTAHHTPRGGWWSGGRRSGCCWGLLRGACVCGAVQPGRGCLWADRHRLPVMLLFWSALQSCADVESYFFLPADSRWT